MIHLCLTSCLFLGKAQRLAYTLLLLLMLHYSLYHFYFFCRSTELLLYSFHLGSWEETHDSGVYSFSPVMRQSVKISIDIEYIWHLTIVRQI